MPTIEDFATGRMRRETDRIKISGRLAEVAHAAVDVTAPHSALTWHTLPAECDGDARLEIPGQQFIFPDGVYGWLDVHATRTALTQFAGRVKVPVSYLDRLTPDHWDLAAQNLNTLATREDQNATLRLLRCDDGYLLRAVVSDRYAAIDNVDMLNAVVHGLRDAAVGLDECEVDADWSLDRFRLRIAVPQIAVAAPDLLADYRPLFSMLPGRDVHARPDADERSPLIWAGLEVSNGETGGGALRIVPRAVVEVCRNGLTRTADMFRQIHVGERLDEGIRWSQDTRRLSVELIQSKMTDAVRLFCSTEYLAGLVNEMRAAKGLEVQQATAAITVLARTSALTDDEAQMVLNLFAGSSDSTVFGLGQALTAAAQHCEDGERQAVLEDAVWGVYESPRAYAEATV